LEPQQEALQGRIRPPAGRPSDHGPQPLTPAPAFPEPPAWPGEEHPPPEHPAAAAAPAPTADVTPPAEWPSEFGPPAEHPVPLPPTAAESMPAASLPEAAPSPVPELPPEPAAPAAEAPRPTQPPPTAEAISPSRAAARGADAFLRGAGISSEQARAYDVRKLEQAGALFRRMVHGTMEILAARTKVKQEFQLERTTVQARGNNPLKFLPTPEDALRQLLLPRQQSGYLLPEESIDEAFEDIKAHQIATFAGIQAAFREMFAKFNPAALEAAFAEHARRPWPGRPKTTFNSCSARSSPLPTGSKTSGCGNREPTRKPPAMKPRIHVGLACVLLSLGLGGCGMFGTEPEPEPTVVHLTIVASDDVNPDPQGRASPLVVEIYRLTSTGAFECGLHVHVSG
jgi:type VI secretion system FHA domain protein